MSKKLSRNLHIFGGGIFTKTAIEVANNFSWKVTLRTTDRFKNEVSHFSKKNLEVFSGNSLEVLLKKGSKPNKGDIAISFSAPWIISKKLINSFEGKFYNLHNQPLPKFRGGGGSSWNILMKNRSGGSCIHLLTEKIDAGDIYARENFTFPKKLKYPRDYDDYSLKIANKMLKRWLTSYLSIGSPGKALPNNDSSSEYWPRLNTEIHGWIDWSWSLSEIESFCHAFSFPHSGAKTYLGKKIIRILDLKVFNKKNKFHPFQAGLVFRKTKNEIYIAHKDGHIQLDKNYISPNNKNIRLGDRFHTPYKKLDNSLFSRIQYSPDGKVIKLK